MIYRLPDLQVLENVNCAENDLEDVKDCHQLRELRLSGFLGHDMTPIGQLTDLEILELESRGHRAGRTIDQVLSPLSGLNQLDRLTVIGFGRLDHSSLDLNPLKGLTRLRSLELSANGIENIEPLTQLSQLQKLVLSENRISDLEPLRELRKLQVLYLDENQINNVEPLSNLRKLQFLRLDKNNIQDIEPLGNLPDLRSLNLAANQTEDVTALSRLSQIGDPLTLKYDWRRTRFTPGDETLFAKPNYALDLSQNVIHSIQGLVRNNGLDEGDVVILKENPLRDRAFEQSLPALKQRGVRVHRKHGAREDQPALDLQQALSSIGQERTVEFHVSSGSVVFQNESDSNNDQKRHPWIYLSNQVLSNQVTDQPPRQDGGIVVCIPMENFDNYKPEDATQLT